MNRHVFFFLFCFVKWSLAKQNCGDDNALVLVLASLWIVLISLHSENRLFCGRWMCVLDLWIVLFDCAPSRKSIPSQFQFIIHLCISVRLYCLCRMNSLMMRFIMPKRVCEFVRTINSSIPYVCITFCIYTHIWRPNASLLNFRARDLHFSGFCLEFSVFFFLSFYLPVCLSRSLHLFIWNCY